MIFNKCCFKIQGVTYLMVDNDFTDATKCTDSNGKQLNITVFGVDRCKFIQFHDNVPSVINIITQNETFENIQKAIHSNIFWFRQYGVDASSNESSKKCGC